TWYDAAVADDLDLFKLVRRNSVTPRAGDNQFLVVAPRTPCNFGSSEHTMVGQRDVGDARFDFRGLYVRWFDYWLKGAANGVTLMPKVQTYVMGRNQWRREQEWPPARVQPASYYLHSDGHANSRFGSGRLTMIAPGEEPSDRY